MSNYIAYVIIELFMAWFV